MPIWNALLLILLLLAPLAGSASAQGDNIFWHNRYEDAIEEARRTQKPIFLEFRCEP